MEGWCTYLHIPKVDPCVMGKLLCLNNVNFSWKGKEKDRLGISYIITKHSLFFFFFFGLGPNSQNMEVPRPGVKLELQLPATATATATLGGATSWTYSTAPRNTRSLTHWRRQGIKSVTSWLLVRLVSTEPQRELRKHFIFK